MGSGGPSLVVMQGFLFLLLGSWCDARMAEGREKAHSPSQCPLLRE